MLKLSSKQPSAGNVRKKLSIDLFDICRIVETVIKTQTIAPAVSDPSLKEVAVEFTIIDIVIIFIGN